MRPHNRADDVAALFGKAETMRGAAYAPYSNFQVGAALSTPESVIFAGCNVENAAYPVGTCAEAGAIANLAAAGGRRIRDIVVVGPGEEPCFPCGACRQRIREFADAETRIHVRGAAGQPEGGFTIDDLLPLAFGPDNLSASMRPKP
jgi:cytidine deaminase